eukprot:1137877-Pelagomonas_calceolata.AAC.3
MLVSRFLLWAGLKYMLQALCAGGYGGIKQVQFQPDGAFKSSPAWLTSSDAFVYSSNMGVCEAGSRKQTSSQMVKSGLTPGATEEFLQLGTN